jgi:lambda repressor-like predicted transcriptional regulator
MEHSPDYLIARVAAWLKASGTSVAEAARQANVTNNTAHLALKGRGGRIDTLRKLCALVPAEFDHREAA